jgi:pyridoxal phosphate enzyme (YggS family)
MNYKQVLDNIAKAAQACGRKAEEITLVTATKKHTWQEILLLYEAGCRHFGESRLQEALPKIEEAPQDIQWHLIGTLQKNKVSKAIGKFDLIHSVDSFELAKKISECSLTPSSILLQVNISKEATKHGFSEEALYASFDQLLALPSIKIEGLMTMAPYTNDESIIRRSFSGLRILLENLNRQLPQKLTTLSMGMSHDYLLAIEEGATMLRIGSAIFNQ